MSTDCTLARCEPATTPSSPLLRSAPVTEIPTVRLQHPRECPPMVQSLCHDTSDMPSTTPIFFSRPSAMSPYAGLLDHLVVGERADASVAIALEELVERRRLQIEPEDARGVPTVHGARPPRRAVVLGRGGERIVELRGDLRHLGLAEHSSEVQEARFGEEVSDLLGIVVDPEAALEVERAAVTRAEVDRAGLVDRPSVERRAAPAPRRRTDHHSPVGTSHAQP